MVVKGGVIKTMVSKGEEPFSDGSRVDVNLEGAADLAIGLRGAIELESSKL